jgi:hypothetical protein
LLAFCGSPDSTLKSRQAVSCSKPSVLSCAYQDLRAAHRVAVTCPHSVARRQFVITQRCRVVACHRGQIPGVRNRVPISRCGNADLSCLLALLSTPFANVPRKVMGRMIAVPREVAVTGSTIAVGGLVAISRRLIDTSDALIAIGEGLTIGDGRGRLEQRSSSGRRL